MTEILFEKTLRPHRSIDALGQQMTLRVLLILMLMLVPGLYVFLGGVPEDKRIWGALILFGALFAPIPVMFWAFRRRNRDEQLHEIITITEKLLHLQRFEANGRLLEFKTDPYWVEIKLCKDGPVTDYLTLKDSKRHVELGAFLSTEERKILYKDLINLQGRLKHPQNR